MATITFTIPDDGSEPTLTIQGIKGEGCKPIHNAISTDLNKILGIGEMVVSDTPEARERPLTVTKTSTARAR